MVLDLEFYTKDPDGMENAINIFIFLYLTPAARSKADLLLRCWDTILGGGALTYFADTSILIAIQMVAPITRWEATANQLEAWEIVYAILLGNASVYPETYEVLGLLEEATGVGERLQEQDYRHLTFPTTLLHLIQAEFNERFR